MEVELHDVHFQLEGMQILKNINLQVASGECVTVSGRSGCGKSILFSLLCGTHLATQGQVLVGGYNLAKLDEIENKALRKYLGAVFQRAALISNLTLIENLLLPLNLHCPELNLQAKLQRIHKVAREFGFYNYLEWRTDRMSMGMRSLVGMARAIINEPKLLVWDAPLFDVDKHWSRLVVGKLKEVKQSGATLILLTNRKEIISELADRRLLLVAGGIGVATDDD